MQQEEGGSGVSLRGEEGAVGRGSGSEIKEMIERAHEQGDRTDQREEGYSLEDMLDNIALCLQGVQLRMSSTQLTSREKDKASRVAQLVGKFRGVARNKENVQGYIGKRKELDPWGHGSTESSNSNDEDRSDYSYAPAQSRRRKRRSRRGNKEENSGIAEEAGLSDKEEKVDGPSPRGMGRENREFALFEGGLARSTVKGAHDMWSEIGRVISQLLKEIINELKRFNRSRRSRKPLNFGVDDTRTVDEFVDEFEEYAEEMLPDNRRAWLRELRSLLTGKLAEAYDAIYQKGMEYNRMVKKLRRWYQENKEDEQERREVAYEELAMKANESPYNYFLRLESTVEEAFPDRKSEWAGLAVRKFLATVPKSLARRLKKLETFRSAERSKNPGRAWKAIRAELAEDSDSDEEPSHGFGGPVMEPVGVWWSRMQGKDSRPPQQMRRWQQQGLPGEGHGDFMVGVNYQNVAGRQAGPVGQESYNGSGNVGVRRFTRVCTFCKRQGHSTEICRRRLRQCLKCGSPEHQLAQCPQRMEMVQGNGVMQCFKCGGLGHFISNCPSRAPVARGSNREVAQGGLAQQTVGNSNPQGGSWPNSGNSGVAVSRQVALEGVRSQQLGVKEQHFVPYGAEKISGEVGSVGIDGAVVTTGQENLNLPAPWTVGPSRS